MAIFTSENRDSNEMLDGPEWFAECKRLAGPRWEKFAVWYSFQTAFEDGMTPIQAVKDCREWIDGK